MSISWVIFKSQFVIVAIDKPKKNDYWTDAVHEGHIPTDKELF